MEGRATIAEEERSGTGPYVTLVEVAAGGMGRVDVALRVEGEFRRLYAIKRLHPHLREDPDFRQMFIEEARVAGLVRHPNVVSVLDVGVDAAGPYLVMDYVDGVSLSRLTSFVAASDRGLPMQIALRIAIDVARGLHAIHEARGHDGQLLQLVHRDLSPQNVLVAYAGVASITDFGIAKAVGQSQRTSTGVLKGKISYMSPEQLRFESLDRRSDLFAFGVLFYEMLAGQRLYRNGGNEGAQRILHEPPPDLGDARPDAPPALVELVFELLAKHPDERPPNAAAVARRLERVLAQLVVREPTIELGSYVEGITEQVREEQHAAIRAATSRLAKSSAAWTGVSAIPISVDVSMTGIPLAEPSTSVGKIRTRQTNIGRRTMIVAGMIASTSLLAAAAMAWWARGAPPQSSSPAVIPSLATAAEAAPPITPSPRAVEQAAPGASEVAEIMIDEEVERAVESEAEPSSSERPRALRRTRTRSAAQKAQPVFRPGERVGWEE